MLSPIQSPADLQARRLPATSAVALAAAAFAMFWPIGPIAVSPAEAKTPGKTYCFYRVCHRVMTLDETRRAVGKRMVLHASHYDDPKKDRYNPSNLTSSGEWFRAGTPDNAASPKLPNGTVILTWNPATRQSAVLRVNNAGPYWGSRTLDVSRAAAERLGFARQGVAKLHVEIVRAPTKEDVTYRRGRRYAAVPGPIGTHATFELALAASNRMMGNPSPATTTLVASLPTDVAPERDTETRARPASTMPPTTPVVPAMPAAVGAVAALTEVAAATEPVAAIRAAEAESVLTQKLASEMPAAADIPPPAATTPPQNFPTAKVASDRAKQRKPIQTAQAAKPSKPSKSAKKAKPTQVPVVAKAAKTEPNKTAAAQPARVRTRTSTIAQVGTETAMRTRIASARRVALAQADIDDDEVDQPVRRTTAMPQRRAVSSYSAARLPAGCRDESSSCEFEVAGNGRVASVRSWRVSSSKRQ